ncbi:hypothetical protein BC938DRAFT_483899 [Jimgerdemannia flammicorona]|uniref:Transmembrane protein n=1 Tax=Jimgerdemannia flammicorona TaxID=994334 RepID=A0A433QB12_9FUNG|nr:hypothetical protein BC938DRAFT_483899 [Jimgerdemannia flammicorona]
MGKLNYRDYANTGMETSLYYGGTLFVYSDVSKLKGTIVLLDEKSKVVETFKIPLNGSMFYCVAKSNTVFIPNSMVNQTWSYYSFDIRKLLPQGMAQSAPLTAHDIGYNNLNIMNSTPAINQTIPFGNTISLSVDFWPNLSQIKLNSGNIFIYQQNQTYPRQVINANDFTISNSSVQLKKPLLRSTLNLASSTYYAVIDDGFVMTTELIPGVQENSWVFHTDSGFYTYVFSRRNQPHRHGCLLIVYLSYEDEVIVLLKFTDDVYIHLSYLLGLREYYKNSQFGNMLLQELSEFIPISRSRTAIVSTSLYANGSSSPGLYFKVRIASSTDPKEINSIYAQEFLAMMITNLEETNLQYGNITKFLDPNVAAPVQGYIDPIQAPRGRRCMRNCRHKEGGNSAIFTIALNLFGFVLRTIFVALHNRDISTLTWSIVLFYAVPLILNFGMAVGIMVRERSSNEKFLEWLGKNSALASIFTIFAATDVEMLSVLDSHFAGFRSFDATFSPKATKNIRYASHAGFVIGDIPQFCIMIRYNILIVRGYSIVPFPTLIFSAMHLIAKSLTRFYMEKPCVCNNNVDNNLVDDSTTLDENRDAVEMAERVAEVSATLEQTNLPVADVDEDMANRDTLVSNASDNGELGQSADGGNVCPA